MKKLFNKSVLLTAVVFILFASLALKAALRLRAPMPGGTSVNILELEDETGADVFVVDGDGNLQIDGAISTATGLSIPLNIGAFTLTNAIITASASGGSPYMRFDGTGPAASGALAFSTGGPYDQKVTGADIYTAEDFSAVTNFTIPDDYNSALIARFKVMVQHHWKNGEHTSNEPVKLDYNYQRNASGSIGDSTPTEGVRVALNANSYPQSITLSVPDAFTAGGSGTLKLWKSWESYTDGVIKVLSVMLYYNIES